MSCGSAGRFESTLVANPKDRFSRDKAHILLVTPRLEVEQLIPTGKRCWGIEYGSGKLYVSCFNKSCYPESRDGDLKENLKRRLDLVAFEYPFYLTVNDKADRIYVSDRNRSLTCLLPDGSIVYQYTKKDLPISYMTNNPKYSS